MERNHLPRDPYADYQRLREDALRLRSEAIDDFWRGADQVLSGAAVRARRAATRLAQRLSRRRRVAAEPCGS